MLKPHFGCFCALSEPSVRCRINGLPFFIVLSRHRSRVRAPSSPPDSKRLKSNLACDIKVQKGTSSDFDRRGVGWTTSFRTERGSRLAGPLLLLELNAADTLPCFANCHADRLRCGRIDLGTELHDGALSGITFAFFSVVHVLRRRSVISVAGRIWRRW